jgi:hypothetical protein
LLPGRVDVERPVPDAGADGHPDIDTQTRKDARTGVRRRGVSVALTVWIRAGNHRDANAFAQCRGDRDTRCAEADRKRAASGGRVTDLRERIAGGRDLPARGAAGGHRRGRRGPRCPAQARSLTLA